jgi:HAMP domain-containing protein
VPLAGTMLLATACARRPPAASGAVPADAPAWVNRGSGAFNDGARAFYGVGAVVGVQNPALARSSAEGRARAELATAFQTYVTALMRDYQASIGTTAASDEQQMVEQTIRIFTDVDVAGVQIVNHWQDPRSGTLYALARADFEASSQAFNRMSQLNERAREYIRANAERAFDRLEAARQEHRP